MAVIQRLQSIEEVAEDLLLASSPQTEVDAELLKSVLIGEIWWVHSGFLLAPLLALILSHFSTSMIMKWR